MAMQAKGAGPDETPALEGEHIYHLSASEYARLHARFVHNKGPRSEAVIAMPGLVEFLIRLNTGNRVRTDGHQAVFDRAIASGEYQFSGLGVSVTCEGEVIDGQHRLYALRHAGYPPVFISIASGCSPSAKAVLDQGRNRKQEDIQQMAYGNDSCKRWHISICRQWCAIMLEGTVWRVLTPSEVDRVYKMLRPALEAIQAIPGHHKFTAACLAIPVEYLRRYPGEVEVVRSFIVGFATGGKLIPGSALLTYRNKMERERVRRGSSAQVSQSQLTANAFHAHIMDRPLSRLYARVEAINRLFPGPRPRIPPA